MVAPVILAGPYAVCGKFLDDNPGTRAECSKKLEAGRPCDRCPSRAQVVETPERTRRLAFEQAAGVLLGERGRLGKLQQKLGFSGTREAQMGKLYDMAKKIRKLK